MIDDPGELNLAERQEGSLYIRQRCLERTINISTKSDKKIMIVITGGGLYWVDVI